MSNMELHSYPCLSIVKMLYRLIIDATDICFYAILVPKWNLIVRSNCEILAMYLDNYFSNALASTNAILHSIAISLFFEWMTSRDKPFVALDRRGQHE